ncbi:lipopolysaccharide biosynthesis protein [Sphingomonas sp. SUN019]|uniref:lipopolysaccharide biosynthesis protein n=1 Tax=Sphingomonas sp. SUN019 TaxID=2937788 RepID=UPI0021648443|nr:lipopolysaccharide biosynthesis protein [Sphingomonas sp. SUN019]UVO51675.1 lipopolysaccharide biosynthesis protein [Sphingomonas sp. SUN019]
MRNLAHLTGGKAVSVALGMATLAITAKMLGPGLLGIVAMIESYGRLIDQMIRLETWQTVIRYGARAIEDDDRSRLTRLIKLGVTTDIIGATIVAGVALVGAPVAARLLHWDAETLRMAQIYSAALLFGVSSTPIGILRLFDRFAQAAWVEPVIAAIRLAAIATIWLFGGSVWAVVLLGVALIILERLVMSCLAWRVLRQEGVTGVLRAPLRGAIALFPGIAGFVLAANGTVLIRKSTQEADVLIVGAIAGSVGAGLYQLARKVALAAAKGGQMIQQAAFPELARLWAAGQRDRFLHLVGRIEWITLGLALLLPCAVALMGPRLIPLIAGDGFEDAYVPLLVQSFAVVIFLGGSALRAALMAAGGQGRFLAASALAAIAFYATIFPAVHMLGVVGAAIAHIVFNAVSLPLALATFRSVTCAPPATPYPPAQAHD